MIKKYSVLVGLVFMLGIVGCQQTQNTTGNSSEERLEDKSMEEQLISKEFLMEQCRITEEELEGIDADAFIEKYGLTESTIKKVKIPVILEDYRQEMQEENLEDEVSYHYLTETESEEGTLTEEEIPQIQVIAFYMNEGTYQETLIFDRKSKLAYFGKVIDLLENHAKPTKQKELSRDELLQLEKILKDSGIQNWKRRYEGSSEGTTGWFHWRLFLEMEDGRVFDYSGSGAAGDSTPETYNLFTEKLHDMIEE